MALITIYISLLVPSGGLQITWKAFIHQLNGAHGCQSLCALIKHAQCLQSTNKRQNHSCGLSGGSLVINKTCGFTELCTDYLKESNRLDDQQSERSRDRKNANSAEGEISGDCLHQGCPHFGL